MWGYSFKAGPDAPDITFFSCIYFLISRIKLKSHNNILLVLANWRSHCSTFPVLNIQSRLKKRIKNTYFHFCCFTYFPEIVILSLNFIDKILLLAIFFSSSCSSQYGARQWKHIETSIEFLKQAFFSSNLEDTANFLFFFE